MSAHLRCVGAANGAPRLVQWSSDHVAIAAGAPGKFSEAIARFLTERLAPFAIVVGPDGRHRVVAIDEYVQELRSSGADGALVELLEQCDASALVVYTAATVAAVPIDAPELHDAIRARERTAL